MLQGGGKTRVGNVLVLRLFFWEHGSRLFWADFHANQPGGLHHGRVTVAREIGTCGKYREIGLHANMLQASAVGHNQIRVGDRGAVYISEVVAEIPRLHDRPGAAISQDETS